MVFSGECWCPVLGWRLLWPWRGLLLQRMRDKRKDYLRKRTLPLRKLGLAAELPPGLRSRGSISGVIPGKSGNCVLPRPPLSLQEEDSLPLSTLKFFSFSHYVTWVCLQLLGSGDPPTLPLRSQDQDKGHQDWNCLNLPLCWFQIIPFICLHFCKIHFF